MHVCVSFSGSIGVALSVLQGTKESAESMGREVLDDILSDDISEIGVEVRL